MGCGSSSTQVKEPSFRQNTPTFKKIENHNHQTSVITTREKSASSKKSNSKDSSSSASSSASSLKERAESGKSSRAGSAKSDRDKQEKEFKLKKAGKSEERSRANIANVIEIVEEDATYDVTDSKIIEATNIDDLKESERQHKSAANSKENGETVEGHLKANSEIRRGYESVEKDTTGEEEEEKEKQEEEQGDNIIAKQNNIDQVQKKADEFDEFAGIDLSPIIIPETSKDKEFPGYTLDDIVSNNSEKGQNFWFLYGRKIYSLNSFTSIVAPRVQEYLDHTGEEQFSALDILKGNTDFGSYPVYVARNNGVRRKEMDEILPASQVGKLVSISKEDYISRLKHCVENVKSDLEAEEKLTEYLADLLEQLSRWLSSYPNVEIETPLDRTNVDPNQCEFPLPDKIRADSTVIRHWAKDWEVFDMSLDEDGAWPMFALLNEDMGDVHEMFVDLCAGREDQSLPEMNMEIDGEAAWDVIQIDLVKNDVTTEKQEEIWKAREKRKDLNDKERMRRRRKQIADSLLKRHDTRLKAEDMVPYVDWAQRLEEHWKEFQTLCENYVPRPRVADDASKLAELEPKKLTETEENPENERASRTLMSEAKSVSDKDQNENAELLSHDENLEPSADAANRRVTAKHSELPENIPPQDTMSIRSDHGLN